MLLPIRQIVDATEAEGPGLRTAIWLQGCPLRCPGCCNPEMLAFGLPADVGETPLALAVARLRTNRDVHRIEGISLLGGEPTAHAAASAALAQAAHRLGLGVMVYSGFTLAELRSRNDVDTARLLALTDLLVDGPYDRTQPEPSRRWIGSANQEVHFLTDRYSPADPAWRERNTVEVRLSADGVVSVNGFPGGATRALQQGLAWRRGKRR